jgi:hypothetical protein
VPLKRPSEATAAGNPGKGEVDEIDAARVGVQKPLDGLTKLRVIATSRGQIGRASGCVVLEGSREHVFDLRPALRRHGRSREYAGSGGGSRGKPIRPRFYAFRPLRG